MVIWCFPLQEIPKDSINHSIAWDIIKSTIILLKSFTNCSDNGVEKLDGDLGGLVALAGELGPPEGAHCEGRPAQVHGDEENRFYWIKEDYKAILSFLRENDLKCVTFHLQSGHLASSLSFTRSTACGFIIAFHDTIIYH